MRTRYIPLILCLTLSLIIISARSYGQQKKFVLTKEQLATAHSIFIAQTALPTTGSMVNLTSEYEVRFSKDSIISYLPYYGRAYNAGYDMEGGLRFTSTSFDYKIKERTKGRGWEVSITPKDTKDVRQLYLLVSPNGSATLQVTSLNRQPISFNGYIKLLP